MMAKKIDVKLLLELRQANMHTALKLSASAA